MSNEIILVNEFAKTLPFDSENQVLNITPEALRRTVSLESVSGKMPAKQPVEHIVIIDRLQAMADQHGYPTRVENLYIKDAYCKRTMWPNKDIPCPLDHYLVNRVIGKIVIDRPEEKGSEFGSTIAFSYSEAGIEISLGANVWDCTNYNIFGQYRVSTFGSKKTNFDQMLELFEKWIMRVPQFFNEVGDKIARLRHIQINENIAQKFFGQLFMDAVHQNYDPKFIAPLNQSQVAATVRNYLRNETDIHTMWDVCNAGTEALHIYRNDFGSVLQSIEAYNDRVEQFSLSHESSGGLN